MTIEDLHNYYIATHNPKKSYSAQFFQLTSFFLKRGVQPNPPGRVWACIVIISEIIISYDPVITRKLSKRSTICTVAIIISVHLF